MRYLNVKGFKRRTIALFWALLFCSVAFANTNPSLSSRVDKDKILIGEIIQYSVECFIPDAAEYELPHQDSEYIGEFTIKGFKQKERKVKNGVLHTLDYQLTILETGTHTIDAYVLQYRHGQDNEWLKTASNPLEIKVESLLNEDADPEILEIKQIKPKIKIWDNVLTGVLIALASIAIIILTLWFISKRQKKISLEAKILPAHIIAYKELEKIKWLELIRKGMIEEYFDRLSSCIRHYLEGRFDLRAPWMSTEEFLTQAKTSALLNTAHKKLLKRFLELSDLVKFARYSSSAAEAEDSFIVVKNFIDQTKQEIGDLPKKEK